MIFYAIRHITSKQLMPTLRKGRGYTHWNPSSNRKLVAKDMKYPRLFQTRKSAERVVRVWFSEPNLEMRGYTNYHGEDDYDLKDKPDGRKKEDLEIVKVELRIKQ